MTTGREDKFSLEKPNQGARAARLSPGGDGFGVK
jgi:hypothetical protein